MSFLTPIDGGKLSGSIQMFECPSDAYRHFDCKCGSFAGITETPEFDPQCDEYTVLAECQECGMHYFVVGIKRQEQMDDARMMVMQFFAGVKDAGRGQ